MKLESFRFPIGALAFCEHYLLSAEGNILKILLHTSAKCLLSTQIFRKQFIHGIRCYKIDGATHSDLSAFVLLWGGRSISVLKISQGSEYGHDCRVRVILPEIESNARIVEAILKLPDRHRNDLSMQNCMCFAVTAQNQLLLIRDFGYTDVNNNDHHTLHALTAGPQSLILSASLSSTDDGTLVVASGTITGEIYVWTFRPGNIEDGQAGSPSRVHKLEGHNGSVFGLDISPDMRRYGSPRRLLATCSDDRALQLYDITPAFAQISASDVPTECIGRTTGHASRIWSVHFLHSTIPQARLFSLGEDGTAQLWTAAMIKEDQFEVDTGTSVLNFLTHDATFAYHSGKNLRAFASCQASEDICLVATGGADSRIVTYEVNIAEHEGSNRPISMASNINKSKLLHSRDVRSGIDDLHTRTEEIFNLMMGHWQLSRVIESALPSQPAGALKGIACLVQRPASGAGYELECLYSEEGDFTSDLGFVLKARRQYVYRYSKQNDEISVWFTKPDGESVDYLFHTLDLENQSSPIPSITGGKACKLTADGHHLCEQDVYDPRYTFRWNKEGQFSWTIRYSVKGPQKDYVSEATYAPQDSPDHPTQLELGAPEVAAMVDCKRLDHEPHNLTAYSWLSDRMFATSTEGGDLMIGRLISAEHHPEKGPLLVASGSTGIGWSKIGLFEELRPSSVISKNLSSGLVVLGGNRGSIYTYDPRSSRMTLLLQTGRKISYLNVQECPRSGDGEDRPLIYLRLRDQGGLNSAIYRMNLTLNKENQHSLDLMSHFSKEHSKLEFVTTTFCYLPDFKLLLEGSRSSELRVRNLQTDDKTGFKNLHGQDAITAILQLPAREWQAGVIRILTAGRDGRVAYHELQCQSLGALELRTTHESKPPFERKIEGARIDASNKHVILWGFRGPSFIVWDETARQETMSVPCGGSHRQWSFLYHDGTRGGSFVCTKASTCLVKYQHAASHYVLQPGSHGREIKALAIRGSHTLCPDPGTPTLIATGAEDTNIQISKFDGSFFRTLAVLTKHTTGIQKLEWSNSGNLLVSCGGCEEMFVWRVQFHADEPHVMCEAVCPTTTLDTALRVMDIAVMDRRWDRCTADNDCDISIVTAYSDSSIRVWHFDVKASKLSLVNLATNTACCLTQIQHVPTQSYGMVVTTASDGQLGHWDFENCQPHDVELLSRHSVHQGSIHALVVIEMTAHGLDYGQYKANRCAAEIKSKDASISSSLQHRFLVTGGDDQALGITHSKWNFDSRGTPKLSTTLVVNAHASAIVDIVDLGGSGDLRHRIATVGTDQKLKVWQLGYLGGCEIHVETLAEVELGVADASVIRRFTKADRSTQIMVAGIGLECWTVGEEELS